MCRGGWGFGGRGGLIGEEVKGLEHLFSIFYLPDIYQRAGGGTIPRGGNFVILVDRRYERRIIMFRMPYEWR